ncbi:putative transcriptional regulator [Leptolyngbya sp. PCC 7375]|nr:putative transcriptional regulator [Leptolyngbya sp. PCC 7375]
MRSNRLKEVSLGLSLIIFRITEAMARYKVSVNSLADELGVSRSAISQWRQGNTKPDLDRLNTVMNALLKIGDKSQLEIFPLQLSDLLEWKPDKSEKEIES